MSKLDPYELEVLEAYESGKLKPIGGKAELQRLRAAARATAIKDKLEGIARGKKPSKTAERLLIDRPNNPWRDG